MVLYGVTKMDKIPMKQIVQRIERLEKAVFVSDGTSPTEKKPKPNKHKGATGGIRLLIDEGFFNKKRFFGDICDALATRGYHYSKQAFQEALTRLSTKKKVLVALDEKGKKVYAIRK